MSMETLHKHHIVPIYKCIELGLTTSYKINSKEFYFKENMVEVPREQHAFIHWGYGCKDLKPLLEVCNPPQWVIDMIPLGDNRDIGAAAIIALGEIEQIDISGKNNPMYKHGLAIRSTSSDPEIVAQFKENMKQYKKQYYENNKEKIAEYQKDNKEKIVEYKKQYYEDNKEKIVEQSKQYYEDNKENKAEYNKQYYENNKEKIAEYRKDNKENKAEYNKQYYEDNKEKIVEQSKQYYEDNKEKIVEYQKQYREKQRYKETC